MNVMVEDPEPIYLKELREDSDRGEKSGSPSFGPSPGTDLSQGFREAAAPSQTVLDVRSFEF